MFDHMQIHLGGTFPTHILFNIMMSPVLSLFSGSPISHPRSHVMGIGSVLCAEDGRWVRPGRSGAMYVGGGWRVPGR